MRASRIVPAVLAVALAGILQLRVELTGRGDSGAGRSPAPPHSGGAVQQHGPTTADRLEPGIAPGLDEPPFRLVPPIPCREMTDKQLGAWIGYLVRKEEQYSRLAKTYAALSTTLRTTHGAERPGNQGIDGERTALAVYLERRLGKPLDLGNLDAVECSQVALTFEDLVGRIRGRRDEAVAEQNTPRGRGNKEVQ